MLFRSQGDAKGRSYFINVKGPELLNKYVGETERQIRLIFQRAREKSEEGWPVIVFFDEMDSMFRTRGTGVSSDMESTIVPQLLAEIDGVESLRNVIVIGATNREDLIDPAILRPGRLDVKIRVDRPDDRAAAQIFARYLDADIELFACDADHAWAIERSPDDEAARAELAACLTESRRYLGALRSSIAAADLRMTTRAACATSFTEGVADRVAEGGHDLVIKNFTDGAEPQRTASAAADLALAEVCRVPLMLTRRRPWRPEPRIWVALDLQRAGIAIARRVVEVARDLEIGRAHV